MIRGLLFTIAWLGASLLGVEAQGVATAATLGTAVSLTSTAQSYTYAVGPPLFVVSAAGVSAGATVTVNTITSVASTLPDGFSTQSDLLPPSLNAAIGFSVVTSVDVSSSFQMALTTPAITVGSGSSVSGLINSGGLAVVYFDVTSSAYAKIPASQVTVDSQNRLVINYNRPGYFYILKFDSTPVKKAIDAGAVTFRLAANSSQSVAVSYQQQTVLTISNILAASAALSVSLSNQAQAESTATVLAGRRLVSQIFTISYDGAAGTLQQATLVYNTALATSSDASIQASSLVWCKFDTAANVWVEQSPSTLDAQGQLSFTTKGFSDWSVQAQATRNAATTLQLPLASLLGLALVPLVGYYNW